MIALAQTLAAKPASKATEFKLANGMQVVVIPDTRSPVVTHMVWYRVGAADEPKGVSGIAHFLEHLMFKSTDKIAMGEFSKIVSRLGGQDNAFTGHDATAYFQRIAKDRLPTVMEMEADRMVNLKLTEKEVLTERNVILEERRSRVENSPNAILDEQMAAALYLSHPYNIPVIGWEHEIAKLSPTDALNFYKRHYAPNNAILVVAGDVTVDEVKRLAEGTYGKIPANPAVGAPRQRPQEPPHRSPRRLSLEDARAGKPSVSRYYQAPSYVTGKPGEGEALDLLMKIVAEGSTSRLYRSLVMDKQIASSAGGYYSGSGLDYGSLGVYAVAADGKSLEQVEAAIDAGLAEVKEKGVTDEELQRAKNTMVAAYVYESDNQSTLARRYGWNLIVGRTIADVDNWPDAIAKVTTADVKAAAEKHLELRQSVTGYLVLPPGAAPRADAGGRANPGASPASLSR
ncbi:MAG: insulinase family protein [Hyphomicrobiaceae bacterium]|nr:insulinase family protein [Hyphomicrobiaceae bacterium]